MRRQWNLADKVEPVLLVEICNRYYKDICTSNDNDNYANNSMNYRI